MGDDVRYNHVAKKVMKRQRVMIDDLHAKIMEIGFDAFSGPGDVHFTKETSEVLAGEVAESIRAALTERDDRPNIDRLDLSSEQPGIAKAMKLELDRTSRSQGIAIPQNNPDFKSGKQLQSDFLGIGP